MVHAHTNSSAVQAACLQLPSAEEHPIEASAELATQRRTAFGYSLPNSKTLKEGESLASLIVRNAEPYRFRDPVRVLRRIRQPGQTLQTIISEPRTPEFHTALAALLGLECSELERISYPTTDATRFSFKGHILSREFWLLSRRRYCPLCLRHDAFHQMAWDLAIVTACPTHAVRLVDDCPRCHHPLNWRTGTLTRCPRRGCWADLRDREAMPLADGSLRGTKGVLEALACGMPDDVGPPGATASDLTRLAFQLGAFGCGFERVGRPIDVLKRHPESVHQVLDGGWQALEHWPFGFHAMLERLRARAGSRKGRYGLRKEFGYLSHWLFRFGGEPWCRPVAEAFAEYAATQTDFATTASGLRRYGSLEALRHRHMTMGEASRFLGVAPETMAELAAREKLFLVPPSGAGAPTLVRADRVRELRDRKESELLKQEAERLLCTGRDTLRELEQAGLLPVVPPAERVMAQRLYRKSDIEKLLADLEAKVPPGVRGPRQRRLLTLSGAARGQRAIGKLCCAILAGTLRPAAVHARAKGLKRLLVDPEAVAAAFPAERQTLTVLEAASELGVADETARLWVRLGFFKTAFSKTPKVRGLQISRDDLQRFRAEYATAAVIAAETGIGSGRWAAERLGFLGVKAVSGPMVNGGEAHLFRRADLAPAILERMRAWTERRSRNDKSTKAAFDLAAAIARRAGELLGTSLVRHWNGFSDTSGTVFVQALTGRRRRFMSKYEFRFNVRNVARLNAAKTAWVAFAFLGQSFFLLVPWSEVRPMLDASSVGRRPIIIPVNSTGGVGMFSEHRILD